MFLLDELQRFCQQVSGSPKGDKLRSMRADRLLKILERFIYVGGIISRLSQCDFTQSHFILVALAGDYLVTARLMWENFKSFRKQIFETLEEIMREDLRILRERLFKTFQETTTACPICDTILTAQGGIMAKWLVELSLSPERITILTFA
jgi:hypothetical protein